MSLTRSLFSRGLAPRLAVALLYGALAACGVALVARPRSTAPAAGAAAPEAVGARAVLCIQSVEPVATWEVRLDGAALTARLADEHTWLGEAEMLPASGLVVDAAAQDASPGGRANALRIRVAGTTPARDETIWCNRAWSAARRIDELAVAATPIDPADLP